MEKEQTIRTVEETLAKLRSLGDVTMPASVARKIIEVESILEEARKLLLLK